MTINVLNTGTPDYHAQFKKDPNNRLYTNAITNNPINKVVLNRDIMKNLDNTFSNSVDYTTEVTNQHHSGRCWLFSFTNLLRHNMIKNYGLREDFQLSQNYLSFHDKIEKAQYFLEKIYKTRKLPIGDHRVRYFLKEPITDGGFWNMACNLVKKYGIVPLTNMHETYQSTNSKKLNFILNKHLRKYAYYVRIKDYDRKQFEKFLNDKLYVIYKILVSSLGEPPQKFTWEYYLRGKIDGRNMKKLVKDLTPTQFFTRYVNFNPDDYYILTNIPLKKYPFYKLYEMDYCNNMKDGRPPIFINVPIKEIVHSVRKSIDAGNPVWFGSDVHHFLDRKLGIADLDIYDYDFFEKGDLKDLDKANRILYRESSPNHAMLILGYDEKKGKVHTWLIENSWGTGKGSREGRKGGFIHMTNDWFKEYVYEVVVNKDDLSDKVYEIIKNKSSTTIEPWDLFPCEALSYD